jgi:hypothetical protein
MVTLFCKFVFIPNCLPQPPVLVLQCAQPCLSCFKEIHDCVSPPEFSGKSVRLLGVLSLFLGEFDAGVEYRVQNLSNSGTNNINKKEVVN